MIHITSQTEYDYIKSRGYEPLINWQMFQMDIKLRVNIQRELFGAAGFQQENQKFYKWCWDNKPHYCEETAIPLQNYSSVFISHIISRGADRRMSIDPRNINILSFEMHRMWESSRNINMNVYRMNQHIINLLKKDYIEI